MPPERPQATAGGEGRAIDYGTPTKRSVTIAGHETSISLEPMFWSALETAASAEGVPLNALIARIDIERMAAATPPNLTSAVRQWLWGRAAGHGADE
jgi:predicted DNA-binding ribbon-helix-helix protein